jgi:hypothetical protein
VHREEHGAREGEAALIADIQWADRMMAIAGSIRAIWTTCWQTFE